MHWILVNIYDSLLSLGVEFFFALFFAVGFTYMRKDDILNRSRVRKMASQPKKVGDDVDAKPQASQLHKALQSELAAGNAESALNMWRAGQRRMPTRIQTLKLVAQAFLEADPDSLVREILGHVQAHKEVLGRTRTVTGMLDVIARSGNLAIMDQFVTSVKQMQGLRIPLTSQTYEVLLGGHAAAGDEPGVTKLFSEIRAAGLKTTPRAYAFTIKGFLNNRMLDTALQHILDMQVAGLYVPTFAVTQLFRTACEAGRGLEIFDQAFPQVPVPPDATVLIMEDASKRNDLEFALHVEKALREASQPMLPGAYESLLKLCIVNADMHALQVFEHMQKAGLPVSENFCVGLLARCAEYKFLCFAEAIARCVRGQDGMTIGVYSALMKCYAFCGMYDKACDLYGQMRSEGLEPDNVMYGCLMKFSVECGRTELSRELFSKAPSLEIQNYMAMIQAAGRDKDVARAFSLLRKLEDSGVSVDLTAYSCVLDACVCAGEMQQARAFLEQMKKKFARLDTITFNTLLKGYCSLGDVGGAKDLLHEMTSLGYPPNEVSFNCLINAAVSKGDFTEAWETVQMMEQNGVSADHYTLSIIMKSLKRAKDPNYVNQAFDLLDRTKTNICSDEVLLNTVIEACVRHSKLHRLDVILQSLSASTLWPSVYTYGALIKACGTLKRVDRCWDFWQVMIEERGMEPNDIVIGCMLDALVCNNMVFDAVNLFKEWKESVPPNTVMYATIIKGCANNRLAELAMDMWREMRDLSLPMNSMVYHSLIDAQARVGAMEQVSELIEDMVANGCKLDVITYSTIVKGYCAKGDLDKACEVFRGMQANAMAANCVIYNIVLDGCTKHNRMDLADSVIEDMERNDVKQSNFTLGILVKMYGRRGQLNKAFEVLEMQAEKHGLEPNLQVKTCLMCACLYNHDFERAFRVFKDLKSSGQGADAKAYSALISGIARNSRGRLPEAARLVKEAYGLTGESCGAQGGQPAPGVEEEALDRLLRALGQQGMMNSVGVPLLEQLRAARVPISGRIFSSFLG